MLIDTPAITDLAIDLHSLTLAKGGTTIHPETGEALRHGYAIPAPGGEMLAHRGAFTTSTIRAWIKRDAIPALGLIEGSGHSACLRARDNLDGDYALSVCVVVDHLTEALNLARRFRQRAVYDIEGGKSIDIPREPSDN